MHCVVKCVKSSTGQWQAWVRAGRPLPNKAPHCSSSFTTSDMTSMFSPFGLPEGITLLITDALSAPANFILHRTLAAYMKKDCKDIKCVVLSVSEDITRWKAIASKSVIIIFSVFLALSEFILLKQETKFFRISICSIVWTRDLLSS